MCTPSGNEISVTGPLMHGGLGGSGNSLSHPSTHLCSLHPTWATRQAHPQPYLSTRGPWQKCHNKTVSSFFSLPLGFVFLHGYGITAAVPQANWSLLNWRDPGSHSIDLSRCQLHKHQKECEQIWISPLLYSLKIAVFFLANKKFRS